MININTIKHIALALALALALVAGIALAGGTHAQTGKKEQEPIFTGTVDELSAPINRSGGTSGFIRQNAGKRLVLQGEFKSYRLSEDEWKKKFVGYQVKIVGTQMDIRGNRNEVNCLLNERSAEPMLMRLKQGQSIRVTGEVSEAVPFVSVMVDLVRCQVL